MALETPAHRQRFDLTHRDHLIHATLTLDAANAAGDVTAVREEGVVRRLVNTNPRNRLPVRPGLPQRLKFRGVLPDVRMAVHTNLRRRDRGELSAFDIDVAISTVES